MEKRNKELALIAGRVRKLYHAEEEANGLLVLEAYYGDRKAIEERLALTFQEKLQRPVPMKKILEVTDAVRFCVNDSQLYMKGGSKQNRIGFYLPDDVRPEKAVLYIR